MKIVVKLNAHLHRCNTKINAARQKAKMTLWVSWKAF